MTRSGVCTVAVLGGLVVALGTAGCSGERSPEIAIATPALSFNRPTAPLGSPVEVTYRFHVASDAPRLNENYFVFVHFLDSNEELMWTDDHQPSVPTSEWKPGQHIEYARTVFIPIYPYVGEAIVRMGLYSPQNRTRLPLDGESNGQHAYKVGTLTLLPQSENVFLIYRDGWNSAEVAADNAAVEWQWTKGRSIISFRNPKRDSMIYLHLDGRPDLFDQPQVVTVRIGDQTLDTFPVETRDAIIRKIPVSAEQFGGTDMVDLEILVDRTFVPAKTPAEKSSDPRELGVRVFHASVQPR